MALRTEGQGGRTGPTHSNRKVGESAPFPVHALRDGSFLPLPLTQSLKGSRERGAEGSVQAKPRREVCWVWTCSQTSAHHTDSPSGSSVPPPPSLGDASFTVCSLESIITSKHSFSLSISRSSGHREAEGKCAYFMEGDAEAQGDREVGRLGGPRSWIF